MRIHRTPDGHLFVEISPELVHVILSVMLSFVYALIVYFATN